MVRHFGVFQFKKDISQVQIEECFLSMKAMIGKIPGLLGLEYGPYDGNEGKNEDFTHGFIMTFDSPESRDNYLPHPVHEEVKALVDSRLDRVVVFDFVV